LKQEQKSIFRGLEEATEEAIAVAADAESEMLPGIGRGDAGKVDGADGQGIAEELNAVGGGVSGGVGAEAGGEEEAFEEEGDMGGQIRIGG